MSALPRSTQPSTIWVDLCSRLGRNEEVLSISTNSSVLLKYHVAVVFVGFCWLYYLLDCCKKHRYAQKRSNDFDNHTHSPPLNTRHTFQSFLGWVHQYINRRNNHGRIVDQLEKTSKSSSNATNSEDDDNADPVNILCMDGGGMRAYATLAAMEEVQKQMGQEDDDDDLLHYFDLTCGTSAGGIAALLQSKLGDNRKVVEESHFLLDKIGQECFTKFSFWRLLRTGSLLGEENGVSNILKDRFGDLPLYNPGGLKAFALCTARVDEDHTNGLERRRQATTYKPYVLRSYDMPNAEATDNKNNNKSHENSNGALKLDGTSDVKLWEAMTATSASIFMADPVKLTIENDNNKKKKKQLLVADGFLMCNAPVAIAIAEARQLWPKRPLGVILSFGLDSPQDPFCARAVEAAKSSHSPNIQYFRFMAPPIDNVSPAEISSEGIQKMRDDAVEHARKHSNEIRAILAHLRASGSRKRPSRAISNDNDRRQDRMSLWTSHLSTDKQT